jgi:hypothetical protein
MLGDRKTVVLRGGIPWGFRLSGGGQTPVYIAKVFFCLNNQSNNIFLNKIIGSKSKQSSTWWSCSG